MVKVKVKGKRRYRASSKGQAKAATARYADRNVRSELSDVCAPAHHRSRLQEAAEPLNACWEILQLPLYTGCSAKKIPPPGRDFQETATSRCEGEPGVWSDLHGPMHIGMQRVALVANFPVGHVVAGP